MSRPSCFDRLNFIFIISCFCCCSAISGVSGDNAAVGNPGAVSDIYFRKMKTYFTISDLDKNGQVDADDYLAYGGDMAKYRRLEPNGETYQLFNSTYTKLCKALPFDHVRQGNPVTLTEFVLSMAERRKSPAFKYVIKMALARAFDVFDLDQDGVLSLRECTMAFQFAKVDSSAASVAFKTVDTNGDDGIDRDEARTATIDFLTGDDPNSPYNEAIGPLVL